MKDYYAILGVDKQATDSEIKKAYRKLAGQHHPDRGGDPERFKEVQEAYDVLSDPQRRNDLNNPFYQHYTGQSNFDDILNTYFTKFDMRNQMRNSRISLWISLEDSVIGGNRLVSLGNNSRPIEIQIPKGIHDGENVRYPGLAPGGLDLVINFRVHGHPIWQRDGMDLLREYELDFWQLIMGAEIKVKDLAGKELLLKVPPMTKPESMLRMKGQGITRAGHNPGDIFIKVKAVLPDNIPEEVVSVLSKQTTNK